MNSSGSLIAPRRFPAGLDASAREKLGNRAAVDSVAVVGDAMVRMPDPLFTILLGLVLLASIALPIWLSLRP